MLRAAITEGFGRSRVSPERGRFEPLSRTLARCGYLSCSTVRSMTLKPKSYCFARVPINTDLDLSNRVDHSLTWSSIGTVSATNSRLRLTV